MRFLIPTLICVLLSTAVEAQERSFLPDSLRAAGVSVATYASVVAYGERSAAALERSEAGRRRAERQLRVSNEAIRAIADRLLIVRPNASPNEILPALDGMIRDYVSLQDQLEDLRSQPNVEALWPQLSRVQESLSRGDLTEARVLLEEALRIAERFADPAAELWIAAGDLAQTELRVEDAAAAFDRAADFVPPEEAVRRLGLRLTAESLRIRMSQRTLSSDQVQQQIRTLETAEQTLLGADPSTNGYGRLWAVVYYTRARLWDEVAERGDLTAIPAAVRAWEIARRTPDLSADDQAQVDIAIGSVWSLSATRGGGDASAFDEAARAYARARDHFASQPGNPWLYSAEGGLLGLRISSARGMAGTAGLSALNAIVSDGRRLLARMPQDLLLADNRRFIEDVVTSAQISLAERGSTEGLEEVRQTTLRRLNDLPASTSPLDRASALLRAAEAFSVAGSTADELQQARAYQAQAEALITAGPDAPFMRGYLHYSQGMTLWRIAMLSERRADIDAARAQFERAAQAYAIAGSVENVRYMEGYARTLAEQRRRARR